MGLIPALQMKNVSKKFPGTLAVDNVDFEVYPGEVHALVGENGAGKSTLMKMLAGSFNDYTGQIYIDGKEVKLHSPAIAKANGIAMIYQELSLARALTIAENVLVGRLPVRNKWFLDNKALIQETRACLKSVELDYLDPFTPVEAISQHEAQLVEIAKALGNNPRILVMDEPTSALSREEVERLFKIIGKLKQQGLAIVYISHHLNEIFQVADRVSVMRDGRKVGTLNITDVTPEKLIEMMVGRSISQVKRAADRTTGQIILEVKNLSRYGFFHDISFCVRAGEIVGIAGLAGAGRTELGRAIGGVDPVDAGEIILAGRRIKVKNMARALQHGIAYLTEDRKTEGLALRLTVEENLLAPLIPKQSKGLIYQRQAGKGIVKKLIEDLHISPPDPSRYVGNLSGGNQQKVLLGKWLATGPRVLILDEPTRGVDIGAKVTIHTAIEKLAAQGVAMILISSDLPELVRLSDRILIMRKGHLMGEIPGKDCTEEAVLLAINSEGEIAHAS
ncbi:ABC transporter-like [Moorella glycerini]|uniref:Galactose/methyl galactoside import ATP-binding protein MglA n=1 Tax=Neomoorella stamsii TaxID=1266720 RepID=A0A9X7P4N7_9FIRM|nr:MULTISPECIES: sugar ABC transporter ATP-binding protein [Moorella]PRR68638.1 Galactose/methyl galactoside import ATP-binding protein MglA [Moorella stamsii]CEP69023.1 ABC transporter-like [Moorella glycerini]